MTYLVAYDISDPKRLRRIARLCEDYGMRTQKSVFECHLATQMFQQMWRELCEELDHDEDYLVSYPICLSCSSGVLSAGVAPQKLDNEAFVC